MKVEQKKAKFKPITITLDTRKEAEAFFEYVEEHYSQAPEPVRSLFIELSNKVFDREVNL